MPRMRNRCPSRDLSLSLSPPLITDFSDEAKAEHEITIDWDAYRKTSVLGKAMLYFDHPRCQSLMLRIDFPQACVEETQQRFLAAPKATSRPN